MPVSVQTGRPQSLSSLWRWQLSTPSWLATALGHSWKRPPLLKSICCCSLECIVSDILIFLFSQALSELYLFQEKPLFLLELASTMPACWLPRPSQDTRGLCAVWWNHPSPPRFCSCHSNRCNCSVASAWISKELDSPQRGLYCRWRATSLCFHNNHVVKNGSSISLPPGNS